MREYAATQSVDDYPRDEIERADVPMSPMQRAVGQQMENIGELEEYLSLLEKRLRPVRVSVAEAKEISGNKLSDAIDKGSEVVGALNSNNVRIRRCKQRINALLETLEV